MSLIPMLFSHWWEELEHPHRIPDQHFGHGIHPHDLMVEPRRPGYCPVNTLYRRPWMQLLQDNDQEKGTSTVKADKDKFEVVLDVQQFKPEEIDVKIVDKYVVVSAKHEEKRDEHGWISREFTRKYLIPEQCNLDDVRSSLSSDGVLSITVPRKDLPKLISEKTVKIEHTGKPALKNHPAKAEEKKADAADAKK